MWQWQHLLNIMQHRHPCLYAPNGWDARKCYLNMRTRLIALACRLCAAQELLDKCHPLGMFDSIATLAVAQNMRELYRLVLVDTPLAPYFSENLTHEDLDEMNIEIMRNTLYKAYLDDFAQFCQKLGGATAEIMGDLLAFEVRCAHARARAHAPGA